MEQKEIRESEVSFCQGQVGVGGQESVSSQSAACWEFGGMLSGKKLG